MKHIRKIMAVFFAVIVIVSVTGCGEEKSNSSTNEVIDVAALLDEANNTVTADGKTIISIYAQYADDDTKVPYDYAVEKLAEAYPDVVMKLIIQSKDDGATLKLLASVDQLPDIYQANTSLISSFIETGDVMQLDSVAKSSGYLDKLYESCTELAYYSDGHMYCFPYAGNEYVLLYYNKAVFESCGLEIPTTYDELMNCINVFKSAGIVPLATWQEGWITSAVYDMFATRYNGYGIYGLDTGLTSKSEEGYLAAAQDIRKFADAGLFNSNVAGTDYDAASSLFLNGKAAMFLSGQWFISDAEATLGENVDWMFYPAKDSATYEAAKYRFSGGSSTSGYAVNPKSKNAQLAAEIAEFFAEKYCEAKVMYRGNPLVALNVNEKSETELPRMMTKLSETIPNMTSTTKFTWGLTNTDFNDSLCAGSLKLITGEYSAEDFINNLK